MKKVKASMMNAIHDLPLLVARDEGFFRDQGLDVDGAQCCVSAFREPQRSPTPGSWVTTTSVAPVRCCSEVAPAPRRQPIATPVCVARWPRERAARFCATHLRRRSRPRCARGGRR